MNTIDLEQMFDNAQTMHLQEFISYYSSQSSTPAGEDAESAWPLYGYAPGNYQNKCVVCKEMFVGDKRAAMCIECAVKEMKSQLEAALQNKVPVEPKEWENQLKEAWQSIESVDDAIYFIKQYFTETNGYDALLKEYHEFVDKVPVERYDLLSLTQLFDNNFDCYADTREENDDTIPPTLVDGSIVPAMTKEKFLEIWLKKTIQFL